MIKHKFADIMDHIWKKSFKKTAQEKEKTKKLKMTRNIAAAKNMKNEIYKIASAANKFY